ncbi:ABC transporter permease [Candidatus Sumerlaeota bacterium]
MAIQMEIEVLRNRRLLWILVKRDFKTRYAGSVIGVLWSVINPLLMLAIYVTVIGFILGGGRYGSGDAHAFRESFAVFLCCGLWPWMCVCESLMGATNSITANSSLIKKSVFPMAILPVQALVSAFINFFITFSLFLLVLAGLQVFGGRDYLGLPALLLPLLFAIQFCLLVGFSLLVATINVFFRDMAQILNSFLMIGFWITPIIYNPADTELRARMANYPDFLLGFDYWVLINPFAHLVGLYQAVCWDNVWPSWISIVYLLGLGAIGYIVGKYLFTRSQVHFVDDI